MKRIWIGLVNQATFGQILTSRDPRIVLFALKYVFFSEMRDEHRALNIEQFVDGSIGQCSTLNAQCSSLISYAKLRQWYPSLQSWMRARSEIPTGGVVFFQP